MNLGSIWGQAGVKLGSSWCQAGVKLGSSWGQAGVKLGSSWGQAGVKVQRPTWRRRSALRQVVPGCHPSRHSEQNTYMHAVHCP